MSFFLQERKVKKWPRKEKKRRERRGGPVTEIKDEEVRYPKQNNRDILSRKHIISDQGNWAGRKRKIEERLAWQNGHQRGKRMIEN